MDHLAETSYWSLPGLAVIAIQACAIIFALGTVAIAGPAGLLLAIPLGLAVALACPGYYINQPNQVRVLLLLGGTYVGTADETGFRWTNPLCLRKAASLRVRNFQTERLKVNDARGNPIEIAAVVVWKVVEPAKATLAVESYASFVSIQAETALRALAAHYPYETEEAGADTLRASPEVVAARLATETQERLAAAGLTVVEARISHLAYAPEIAQAMLRRQQAEAVIGARGKLVEGAVSMVEMALRRLNEGGLVHLDEERKAAMVNNLLVALVSEQSAQPVINAGTLHG